MEKNVPLPLNETLLHFHCIREVLAAPPTYSAVDYIEDGAAIYWWAH